MSDRWTVNPLPAEDAALNERKEYKRGGANRLDGPRDQVAIDCEAQARRVMPPDLERVTTEPAPYSFLIPDARVPDMGGKPITRHRYGPIKKHKRVRHLAVIGARHISQLQAHDG